MTDAAVLNQIRTGMRVRTSDGQKLGTVRQVHQRETEVYIEVTLGRSLWNPWLFFTPSRHVFLPGTAVSVVVDKQIEISMDAKTAKACTWHPGWVKYDAPFSNPGGSHY